MLASLAWSFRPQRRKLAISGPAQLGYGDGDEATVIGRGPNSNSRYVTTCFRRRFSVADPSVFASLLVRRLRDDGDVVYLNRTEVFQSNISGGAPLRQMLAPKALAKSAPRAQTIACRLMKRKRCLKLETT